MENLVIINQAAVSVSNQNTLLNHSVFLIPSPLARVYSKPSRRRPSFGIRAEVMATEKMGIKMEKNVPESKVTQLGVRQWPKWGSPPGRFPWTHDSKVTYYLLKGKVKIYPDGHQEFVEFEPGDLFQFPKGMKCT